MKATKKAIILCWIMLIVCFIIKLFGGNWFEIICNNEHFISICSYLDTHIWLRDLVAFPLYVVSTFFLMISASNTPRPKIKQIIIVLVSVVFVWSTRYIADIAKMIFEVVMFIALPFVLQSVDAGIKEWKTTLKHTWYLGIIGCVLDLIFQIISLVTKNIGIRIIESNSLISLILMVDYYIMIALYYLYVLKKNKKEI